VHKASYNVHNITAEWYTDYKTNITKKNKTEIYSMQSHYT